MLPINRHARPILRHSVPPITEATLARVSAPAAKAIPQNTFKPRHKPQGITSLSRVVAPNPYRAARKLARQPPVIRSRNTRRPDKGAPERRTAWGWNWHGRRRWKTPAASASRRKRDTPAPASPGCGGSASRTSFRNPDSGIRKLAWQLYPEKMGRACPAHTPLLEYKCGQWRHGP